LTVNDFVRNTFLGKQNGEIQFWQEMIAGGTAGASQVVSWEIKKNRAKF
jgi:solute carrier family 25 aspartate/glutamate transporter 12/13